MRISIIAAGVLLYSWSAYQVYGLALGDFLHNFPQLYSGEAARQSWGDFADLPEIHQRRISNQRGLRKFAVLMALLGPLGLLVARFSGAKWPRREWRMAKP